MPTREQIERDIRVGEELDLARHGLRGAKLEGGAFNETRYDILTQWPVGFDPSRAGGLVPKERM